MPKVSVIIPARNEQFLIPTVQDLLAKARGDVEVLVVLDGYWPDPPLPDDQRIRVLHRGRPLGMRDAINSAVAIAAGQYLLKCDAHTMWDEGYDEKLIADYQDDRWILIPRRFALDPEHWAIDTSNRKYPIDYHYLSEPFTRHGDSNPGLHGSAWTLRRDERRAIPIDDEMTSQGSGWFMSRRCFDWIGPQEQASYGVFWHEFQEIGLKAWLGGGAVKVTKNTWYAHLYKGARYGRGYSTAGMGHEDGSAFCSWFWMTDQPFPARERTFRWFLEHFWPVPTWPADLDAVFRQAHETFRNPYPTRAAIAHVPSTPVRQEAVVKFEVTSARYGVGGKTGEYVDVTKAVRKQVTDKGLTLTVSNAGLGLVEPYPFAGKRKRLWVEYVADGVAGKGDALERKRIVLPAVPAQTPSAK